MSVKTNRYVRDGEVDPAILDMAQLAAWQAGGGSPSAAVELDAWLYASMLGAFDRQILNVIPETIDWTWDVRGMVPLGKVSAMTFTTTILKASWPAAKSVLEAKGLSEEAIEALLFMYGDEGDKIDEKWSANDLSVKDIALIARAIASSVPPLGKKWLRDRFIREGTPVAEAINKAAAVYASGSNLMAYEAQDERRKVIAALLRLRDPGVTDEQIEKVVASPMTLEQAKVAFAPTGGPTGGPRTEGPRSGAAGGAGAGAGAEGGGMGLLLVGAAVVLGFLFLKK
jgi:hypothetical protein